MYSSIRDIKYLFLIFSFFRFDHYKESFFLLFLPFVLHLLHAPRASLANAQRASSGGMEIMWKVWVSSVTRWLVAGWRTDPAQLLRTRSPPQSPWLAAPARHCKSGLNITLHSARKRITMSYTWIMWFLLENVLWFCPPLRTSPYYVFIRNRGLQFWHCYCAEYTIFGEGTNKHKHTWTSTLFCKDAWCSSSNQTIFQWKCVYSSQYQCHNEGT